MRSFFFKGESLVDTILILDLVAVFTAPFWFAPVASFSIVVAIILLALSILCFTAMFDYQKKLIKDFIDIRKIH